MDLSMNKHTVGARTVYQLRQNRSKTPQDTSFDASATRQYKRNHVTDLGLDRGTEIGTQLLIVGRNVIVFSTADCCSRCVPLTQSGGSVKSNQKNYTVKRVQTMLRGLKKTVHQAILFR
jgi:hypothetical protein